MSAQLWNNYYRKGNTPWQSAGLNLLVKKFVEKYVRGTSVLEIGAGDGSDAQGFVAMGRDYTGMDVSPVAVLAAQKNVPGAGFIVADFLKWKPKHKYPLVYDKGVFHNLPGVRKRNLFVRKVAASLEQDGIWICVCGSADGYDARNPHGAIFLQHLITPAERYFEILEIIKAPYDTVHKDKPFDAWYCVFKKR